MCIEKYKKKGNKEHGNEIRYDTKIPMKRYSNE